MKRPVVAQPVMAGGSSDSIPLRPPRPPGYPPASRICPAPQDIVPEKANDIWQESIEVGVGYIRPANYHPLTDLHTNQIPN